MTRFARINKSNTTADIVAKYLPANYQVVKVTDHHIWIAGEDNAGWTLDDYVLPRLASGLIWGSEVKGID